MSSKFIPKFTVFLISMIVGLMILFQYKAYQEVSTADKRESESNIFRVIKIYLQTNQRLKNEIQNLSVEIQNFTNEYSRQQSLQKIQTQYEMLSGNKKIVGPGLKITLNRSINTVNLVDFVNELWNGGAEALAINEMRLTENSAGFADFGGQSALNGVALTLPLTLEAIGAQQSLSQALNQPGGILSRLQKKDPQLKIELEKVDRIVMEAVVE